MKLRLINLIPKRKDFAGLLNEHIKQIDFLMKNSNNHDNAIYLRNVMGSNRFSKIKSIIFLSLAMFLGAIFILYSIITSTIPILSLISPNYEQLKSHDILEVLIVFLSFFIMGVLLIVLSWIYRPYIDDYNEIENRLRFVLNNKKVNSLSFDEIERILRNKVSKKLIVFKSELYKYINDEITLSRILNYLDETPELLAEQYNRIGAYLYRLKVIVAPSGATDPEMLEIWMKINGNKGAKGSPTLISNPLRTKSETNNTLKKRLKDLIKIFIEIESDEGINMIMEDLAKISK